MNAHPVSWIARIAWLALPFTVGDAIGSSAASLPRSVQLTITIGSWLGWAIGLVALVAPLPITLTLTRFVVPASVLVGGWAAWRTDGTPISLAGVALGVVASGCALSAWVADEHIDGESYGDETRFSLRAPGPLVVSVIPIGWLLGVCGVAAGPLLLADQKWAFGAVVLVVGWAIAFAAFRSIHLLAKRFVVFVPAGMTLVDPTVLVDAVLFKRKSIASLGPAPAEQSGRLDLSQAALGLALEVDTKQSVELTLRVARRSAEDTTARRVAFTPARAAAVLAEADRRGITVR